VHTARQLVETHYASLLAAAAASGVEAELIGRLLLDEIIRTWRESRKVADIASELEFVRDNLDPDAEYAFMRP
jgi:pilus assembly protein TadC